MMWPFPAVSSRMALLVAVVMCVFAAGWFANGWRLKAIHATELRKMQDAGIAALAKRQEAIQNLKGKSREDADRIAKLSRNARVYACTEPDLPGNGTDTGAPGDDRAVREDITPVLRQCLRSFGEINRALIGAINAK